MLRTLLTFLTLFLDKNLIQASPPQTKNNLTAEVVQTMAVALFSTVVVVIFFLKLVERWFFAFEDFIKQFEQSSSIILGTYSLLIFFLIGFSFYILPRRKKNPPLTTSTAQTSATSCPPDLVESALKGFTDGLVEGLAKAHQPKIQPPVQNLSP